MPACPNPKPLPPSKVWRTNYVMVALIPNFTVGVARNGWPPAPTSSPRPISTAPPHLPRSRPGHNITTLHLAHSIGRVEMHRPLRLSGKTARANKTIKGVRTSAPNR